MDKRIIRILISIIILFVGLIVFSTCLKVGSILRKTEKFVDNYKIYNSFNRQVVRDAIEDTLESFTIKGNWLISVDPNGYILFRYHPDKPPKPFDEKEKAK